MIVLDNHTNFTVSPKHMKQQSSSPIFIFLSKLFKRDLAPSLSGHICKAEPGFPGHFLSDPPLSPH